MVAQFYFSVSESDSQHKGQLHACPHCTLCMCININCFNELPSKFRSICFISCNWSDEIVAIEIPNIRIDYSERHSLNEWRVNILTSVWTIRTKICHYFQQNWFSISSGNFHLVDHLRKPFFKLKIAHNRMEQRNFIDESKCFQGISRF